MNTPREPNVRTRPAQALGQARSQPHQHSAPNLQRPTLTLNPKTIRHVDHPVSPAAKPVT
jgi:hypothetical protein